MIEFAATTTLGCDGYLRASLESQGYDCTARHDLRGWVTYEAKDRDDGAKALLSNPFVHRGGPILIREEVGAVTPWKELHPHLDAIDVQDLIGSKGFAMRVTKRGEHNFGSMDFERRVGGRFHENLQALGIDPHVNLKDPQVLIRAHVTENLDCIVWQDIVGLVSMHRRGYQAYRHKAGLRSSIAQALLAEVEAKDAATIVDGCTGGATILIEQAWNLAGVHPLSRRTSPLLVDHAAGFGPYEVPAFDAIQEPLGTTLIGIEKLGNVLQGARANLKRSGTEAAIELRHGTCRDELQEIAKDTEVDVVLGNPPYGRRLGSKEQADAVHRQLFQGAAHALTSKGRLGLVTTRLGTCERLAQEHGFTRVHKVLTQLGDVQAWILHYQA